MSPLDRCLAALEAHGCRPRRSGRGHAARCPAHDDRHPSLTVTAGADGRVLLHCHAGCQADAIAAALGLSMAELFEGREVTAVVKGAERALRRMHLVDLQELRGAQLSIYRARDGKPVFGSLRRDVATGKRIRQWSPIEPDQPCGEWQESLAGVSEPLPLYRLPELTNATAVTVWVVEGEKCAHALQEAFQAAGLADQVTTSAMGAGKAGKTDWTPLEGRRVIVLPDHDSPGQRHADQVAAILHGLGADVTVCPVPGERWPPIAESHGRDVADWLAAGGAVEDLAAEAGRLAAWEPEPPELPSWWTWAEDLGEVEPTDWVEPGFVPADSQVFLHGDPASAKTLIAIHFSVRASKVGPVLFVAGEGTNGLRRRLDAWRLSHPGEPVGRLAFRQGRLNLLDRTAVAEAADVIGQVAASLGPLRLIVVDTLSRCMPGGNENDQAVASQAVDALEVLRTASGGAGVLTLHHDPRSGGRMRGSSVFDGAADVILGVERKDDLVTLRCEKMKDDAVPAPLCFRIRVLDLDDSGMVTGAAVVEEGPARKLAARLTPKRRASLEAFALLCGDGPVAYTEWRSAVSHGGLPVSNFMRDYVTPALRAGEVVKDGGTYLAGPDWPFGVVGVMASHDTNVTPDTSVQAEGVKALVSLVSHPLRGDTDMTPDTTAAACAGSESLNGSILSGRSHPDVWLCRAGHGNTGDHCTRCGQPRPAEDGSS